jgi:hypothetical protein
MSMTANIPLEVIEAIKRQLPSEHLGWGVTNAVYISPEQVLRNQANKIEQDREDRRVIQEWLDGLSTPNK